LISTLVIVENPRYILSTPFSIESIVSVIHSWSKVQHPNVISLHKAFTQNRSLYLIHDYLPGAQSLKEFIIQNSSTGNGKRLNLLSEDIIWSILVQILTAVRVIHSQGLAVRDLSPSRILLTGKYRTSLASAGIIHALEPNPTSYILW
jgi:PAB-dependent poly(A)-specific ribonuclease subunit 3